MTIKINEAISALAMINRIYGCNDHFSGIWDHYMTSNFKVLQPLVEQVAKKDQKEQKKIREKQIEMPLFQISVRDLPKNVPPGACRALKPLLYDYEEIDAKIDLDTLLTQTGESHE